MRSLLIISSAAFVLTALAPAQVVVPSSAAAKQPNYYDSLSFYGTSSAGRNLSQAQWIYDTGDITPAGLLVKSIEVRRPTTIGNSNVATTFDSVIVMSVSPNAHTAPSTTFATNHGTNQMTVFSGKVNLPANTNVPWPAPWLPAITLSTPFPYANTLGKSLVIDIANKNNSVMRTFYIEATQPGNGTRTTERYSCKFAAGGTNSGLSFRYPVVGGSFLANYNNYPKNQASFNANAHIFGSQGKGGSWGGKTLPILFSSFNLPVFDSVCALATDIGASIPAKYNAAAGRIETGTFTLPNNPFLANQTFYTQVVSLDTDPVKGPVVHGSWTHKWKIGDGIPARGATVYRVGSAGTTGSLRRGYATTVRLQ